VSAIHMTTGGSRPVVAFRRAVGADGGALPADPATPDAPPPGGTAAQTRRVMGNAAVVLGGIGPDRPDVLYFRCGLTGSERSTGAFSKVCQSCFPPGRCPVRTMTGVPAPGAAAGVDCIARRPAAGAAA
jgi:enamine deaminase RidA (YjgF/YER057c/UK114 family)